MGECVCECTVLARWNRFREARIEARNGPFGGSLIAIGVSRTALFGGPALQFACGPGEREGLVHAVEVTPASRSSGWSSGLYVHNGSSAMRM